MKYSGRTVAAIIRFKDGKILLVKRRTVPFKGYWALPGGRVDSNETVEQAVMREVKEESGLDVEIIKKIGEYHEIGAKDGVEYDYWPACYLVKPVSGKIQRQETEIEEVQVVHPTEISGPLAFKHMNMVKDYLIFHRT